MAKENREEILAQSNDMTPVAGTVEVNIRPPDLRDRFVGSSGGVFLCAAAGYVRLSEMSGHWDCGK